MPKEKRVSPVRTWAGRAWAEDPSLHEQLVRPWDLCHTLLRSGRFGYRMEYLLLDGVTLYRERYELPCELRGISPPDTLVLSLPIRVGARSHFWGTPWEASGLPAMLPGGLDMRLDRGQEQWVALIDRRALAESLRPDQTASLERAANARLLPAHPQRLRQLGRWLQSLMRLALAPSHLTDKAPVRQTMRDDLIHRLVEGLSLEAETRPIPSFPKRRIGLQRALEFLRDADPVGLNVADLSRAANVSQRTLEYAFRETFGITPLAFIRMRRLHAARASLAMIAPGDATVAQVATDHGFYELGKFSAAFRRHFGELPSRTLSRYVAPQPIKSPLWR